MTETEDWLNAVALNADGLVPAIAQDKATGRILMMAWMNRESLALTRSTGKAVYWSRSRGALWKKGESSGNEQLVDKIQLDCDGDTVVLHVTQQGGITCHTGRESCFFRTLNAGEWETTEDVIKDPAQIYSK